MNVTKELPIYEKHVQNIIVKVKEHILVVNFNTQVWYNVLFENVNIKCEPISNNFSKIKYD